MQNLVKMVFSYWNYTSLKSVILADFWLSNCSDKGGTCLNSCLSKFASLGTSVNSVHPLQLKLTFVVLLCALYFTTSAVVHIHEMHIRSCLFLNKSHTINISNINIWPYMTKLPILQARIFVQLAFFFKTHTHIPKKKHTTQENTKSSPSSSIYLLRKFNIFLNWSIFRAG